MWRVVEIQTCECISTDADKIKMLSASTSFTLSCLSLENSLWILQSLWCTRSSPPTRGITDYMPELIPRPFLAFLLKHFTVIYNEHFLSDVNLFSVVYLNQSRHIWWHVENTCWVILYFVYDELCQKIEKSIVVLYFNIAGSCKKWKIFWADIFLKKTTRLCFSQNNIRFTENIKYTIYMYLSFV